MQTIQLKNVEIGLYSIDMRELAIQGKLKLKAL
jgi:hypothetical protein